MVRSAYLTENNDDTIDDFVIFGITRDSAKLRIDLVLLHARFSSC